MLLSVIFSLGLHIPASRVSYAALPCAVTGRLRELELLEGVEASKDEDLQSGPSLPFHAPPSLSSEDSDNENTAPPKELPTPVQSSGYPTAEGLSSMHECMQHARGAAC